MRVESVRTMFPVVSATPTPTGIRWALFHTPANVIKDANTSPAAGPVAPVVLWRRLDRWLLLCQGLRLDRWLLSCLWLRLDRSLLSCQGLRLDRSLLSCLWLRLARSLR